MRKPHVEIIAPHSDDAAFSLGLYIDAWVRAGLNVRVVTCYTVSQYAPNLAQNSISRISAVRLEEDRAFARRLQRASGSLCMLALGRLDAPLRPKWANREVCANSVTVGDDPMEYERLAEVLSNVLEAPCVLGPLGLGGHIDHVLVCEVCKNMLGRRTIGFYEDLPYAGEYTESELRSRVNSIAGPEPWTLSARVHTFADAVSRKLELLEVYESQLQSSDVQAIDSHCRRLGGRERIWVDGTKKWNDLIP